RLGLEPVQQTMAGLEHLLDRRVESRLIGLGRRIEAAELAYELQRGRADLLVGRRRLEIEQCLDVAAHVGASVTTLDRAPRLALKDRRHAGNARSRCASRARTDTG